VEHTGDNLTGTGEGDDEVIKVDLSKVPAEVEKIAFTVTIHDADARRQNFGQVSNAFIRVVNADNNTEITRYDLAEDASTETAMIFGELYRHSGEWRFTAVGQGYNGGLAAMCKQYGINI
jgi:tellurium resistance protein TerD